MSDLIKRVRSHLEHCHRDDDSEALLGELADAFEALALEHAETSDREDMLRVERNVLDEMASQGRVV